MKAAAWIAGGVERASIARLISSGSPAARAAPPTGPWKGGYCRTTSGASTASKRKAAAIRARV